MLRVACFAFLVGCQPANAQQNCADHDAILRRLAEGYGEAVIGQGLNSAGNLIEVAVNPETGSWTIIGTLPDGPTCLLAAGMSWQSIDQAGEGDPA